MMAMVMVMMMMVLAALQEELSSWGWGWGAQVVADAGDGWCGGGAQWWIVDSGLGYM